MRYPETVKPWKSVFRAIRRDFYKLDRVASREFWAGKALLASQTSRAFFAESKR